MRCIALTSLALVGALNTPSPAQELPPDVRAEIGPGDQPVRLVAGWGRKAAVRLHAGKGKAITLHKGEAAATLAIGHDKVLIALAVDDEREPFRVLVLDGGKPGKPALIARPGKRHDQPFAVAATATPDGFAVFFQEVQSDDPSAAHTYLVRLDDAGAPTGAAVEVPVPWSLAAAIWNGAGYHLALLFPGYGEGMRLSMVSLSAAGQPQQHPDWASAAGYVGDVHLVARDGAIHAVYRGGPGGDRMLESDVTAIRGWGSEPPRATDHGALSPGKVIAVAADGRPRAVASP